MPTIAVGSQNPVKIDAVKQAFEKVFPEESWEVNGVSVDSGVSDQPMNDTESITGARNRAERARDALDSDYGVGLEGGLQEIDGHYFVCGWIVVQNKEGHEGVGSTVRMDTPKKIMELIHAGAELGDANDEVFNMTNSKQAEGHFGLMTNNAITRTAGYRDGVISALAAFIFPDLF